MRAVLVTGGACFAMQGAGQGTIRFAQGVCSSCWQCFFSGAARVLVRALFGVRVLFDVLKVRGQLLVVLGW